MKTRYKFGVAAVIVAGGLMFWLQSRTTAPDPDPPAGLASEAPMPNLPAAPVVFKDTSVLRAPAGAKVAILEFDDLECPACAHAVPILKSTSEELGVPLVHHDYPLTEIHAWSFDAAVTARYLQDKVSPQVADEFRRDVFAHQTEITNKDELDRFTKQWFAGKNTAMPFMMDAGGAESTAVKADRALGDRVGIHQTPTIFVVTQDGFAYVDDPSKLSQVVSAAKSHAGSA